MKIVYLNKNLICQIKIECINHKYLSRQSKFKDVNIVNGDYLKIAFQLPSTTAQIKMCKEKYIDESFMSISGLFDLATLGSYSQILTSDPH